MGVREKKLHSWIKESWNYQGKVVLIHIPHSLLWWGMNIILNCIYYDFCFDCE